MLSSLSGAVGRVALKLGTLFQGKGEEEREWTFDPCGLGFCEGMREGLIEAFLEGLGLNDRVLPRLEDLENALFTVLVSLTFRKDAVSVSSQGLLRLS